MIESNFDRTAYLIPDEPGVDQMNSLLRGEISAVEAYVMVLEKLEQDPDAINLHEFLDDHTKAVAYWKEQIDREGAFSEESSGPWGTAVEAFIATAKLLGNNVAISALDEGEAHGLKVYEEVLGSDDMTRDQRAHVRDVLIPNQRKHIALLDEMKKVKH